MSDNNTSEESPLIGSNAIDNQEAGVTNPPWSFITRKNVLTVRVFLTLYMFALLMASFTYEHARGDGRLFPFLLGNLSWFGQASYFLLTAPLASYEWGFLLVYRGASPPRHRYLRFLNYPSLSRSFTRQLFFSLFYTTVFTTALVTSFVFWYFVFPTAPSGYYTGHRLRQFFTLNLYGVNTIIALEEHFVLNSLDSWFSPYYDLLWMLMLTVAYWGWAMMGNYYNGGREGEYDWRFYGVTDRKLEDWTPLAVGVLLIYGAVGFQYGSRYAKAWLYARIGRQRQNEGEGRSALSD